MKLGMGMGNGKSQVGSQLNSERAALPTVQTLAETLRQTEENIRNDTSIEEAFRPKLNQVVLPERQCWIKEIIKEASGSRQIEVWSETAPQLTTDQQKTFLEAKQKFAEIVGELFPNTTLIYSLFNEEIK
jgi:hypothetical protein